MIKSCKSCEEFEELLRESCQRPVMLFKHSTACPISRNAQVQFEKFAGGIKNVECWRVLVREDRYTSLHIAEQTGIRHESPQAILFIDRKPVWNASHWSITAESLSSACSGHECK